MLATDDKHSALRALRQHFPLLEPAGSGDRPLQPVSGDRLAPAFFGQGLHEVIVETPADRIAASVFALAAAGYGKKRDRALFFASLAAEGQERGLLYGVGLDRLGLDPSRVVLLFAPSEKTLLWAAEEAGSCKALAAGVIVLSRREKLYGFTESRRLKLRLEKSGTPLFIVRGRTGEASAATARWRVGFAASDGRQTPASPVPLLGRPRFRVCLERYAGRSPLQWEIELDEAYALRVVAPVSDRPAFKPRFHDQRAA